MVLAFERNEAGARDARGQPPARFKGHPGVVPGMHHKSRHPDLRQKRGDVHIAVSDQIAGGIGGRTAYPLEFIEPVGLLLGGARNELRREHLPECRVFLAPPEPHQSEHGFAGFLLRCDPGAFLPADSITSKQNQMRNAFGMPDRIGDRNRATLRQAVKCKAFEARGIDHGFEIADKIFKADVRHVTV